ncbi:Rossmann-like and DUF2520 domain-containing protein [Niveibacterium sp. SC-1]|uniref:Rossmann-like and DUF2520 domain-containing protein n=1 Tax=Niveibacterium sp. SC-1 TaxID=3135646 RepID=UPI00311F4EFE
MKMQLNLIGPGRLGRALARLWHAAGLLEPACVLGRDPARTEAACTALGADRSADWNTLAPARLTLIATPDAAIAETARHLAHAGVVREGDLVFHCSGALESDVLAPLRDNGALVASVHPLMSFARPESATLTDVWCACEGDATALAVIEPLFRALGAHCFAVAPGGKLLYHSAAVLACNHLVALMEAALLSMEAAGVPRDTGWRCLQPLIANTLANISQLGTRAALTGPVARGDRATVQAEIQATTQMDEDVGRAYRQLSLLALRLAPEGVALNRAEILAS